MDIQRNNGVSRQRPDRPPQIEVGDQVSVSCGIKELRGRVLQVRPGRGALDTSFYVRLNGGEARWFNKARVSYFPSPRTIARSMRLIRQSHFDRELRMNLGLPYHRMMPGGGGDGDVPSFVDGDEYDSELE